MVVVTTSVAALFMSTVNVSGSLADDGSRAVGHTRRKFNVGVDRREVGTAGRDASSSMSARDDDCVCFDDDDDHRDDGGVAGGRKRGREREVVF